MKFWRIQVSPEGGRPFCCKAERMTPQRLVLQSEQVLPKGMSCDIRITQPVQRGDGQPACARLSGEVEHAIFSGGWVHLSLRLKWLSGEARQLIDKVANGEREASARR